MERHAAAVVQLSVTALQENLLNPCCYLISDGLTTCIQAALQSPLYVVTISSMQVVHVGHLPSD